MSRHGASIRGVCRMEMVGFFFIFAASGEEAAISTGSLAVQFATPPSPRLESVVNKWVGNSARAAIAYYGDFPVHEGSLLVIPVDGKSPRNGQANGWNGSHIEISVGRDATDGSLGDDWELVHELIHLLFPSVSGSHHWIEEGMATYVEPFARTRAGLLSPEEAWSDFVHDLPRGLPRSGDEGLDHTHSWARTYWGGALFWFRVDVEIRKRTGNKLGLEHALRAIAKTGGTIDSSWSIERVISVGDKAVGLPVLRQIYDEMKDAPVSVNLPALWQQLGIITSGGQVGFNNAAPLASIRQAIDGSLPKNPTSKGP